MHALDWAMICAYFALMIVIGWWSHKRVSDVKDFFTAGGKMPWWLAGISHHMSGYSAVLFVAYAGVAYTTGVTVYFWGFASIGIGVGIGSWLFAARWNRLRSKLGVASPLEYLAKRYNVPTQQALAWSGSLLKIFDIAAKWFAVATLLHVFAGLDYNLGILITGAVTLVYCTIGGLWADALTDFGQFVIQAIAAIVMIVVVLGKLGGISALWTMWDKLPENHVDPVTSKYTTIFLLVYVLVKTLEYNGGMWNLAQRYMAAPNTQAARRGAGLSSALYLLWPLVLIPAMVRRTRQWTDVQGPKAARITTVVFVALTMLVATQAQNLGGVLQIVVNWVAALISWAGGLIDYALVYYVFNANQTVLIATPILVSLALYVGLGLIAPERGAAADEIVDTVNTDNDVDRTKEGTTVPA